MTADDWFTRASLYPIPELAGILRLLMMSSVCIVPRWSYIDGYETPAWSSTGRRRRQCIILHIILLYTDRLEYKNNVCKYAGCILELHSRV